MSRELLRKKHGGKPAKYDWGIKQKDLKVDAKGPVVIRYPVTNPPQKSEITTGTEPAIIRPDYSRYQEPPPPDVDHDTVKRWGEELQKADNDAKSAVKRLDRKKMYDACDRMQRVQDEVEEARRLIREKKLAGIPYEPPLRDYLERVRAPQRMVREFWDGHFEYGKRQIEGAAEQRRAEIFAEEQVKDAADQAKEEKKSRLKREIRKEKLRDSAFVHGVIGATLFPISYIALANDSIFTNTDDYFTPLGLALMGASFYGMIKAAKCLGDMADIDKENRYTR